MLIQPVASSDGRGQKILQDILERYETADSDCKAVVATILDEVKQEGDAALVRYTRKFDADGFQPDQLTVSADEMRSAYEMVEPDFLESLQRAIERVESFHQREMEDSWIQTREDGTIVGRLVRPVDSAGLYVPGGQGGSTPLVSSVLMNGIPAGIAGVPRRVMVTPPAGDGSVSPHLLVAAQEIGITEIYKAGSAWGIGALAYGTETIAGVDVIVGPGNQFVAEAKNQVAGMVRIDMIAGPSEVLIVADESAHADQVAADMLAQAEHDSLALSILLTPSDQLAEAVVRELERQLEQLPRKAIAEAALRNRGAVLITEDVEEAVEIANQVGIEHLELDVADPWSWLPKIRHAGAIFLGANSPEAAGDYIAGPNHVLPTMGTARFASALGVETFLKKSSIISYSRQALEADGEHIMRIARLEGLDGHAESVAVRLKR